MVEETLTEKRLVEVIPRVEISERIDGMESPLTASAVVGVEFPPGLITPISPPVENTHNI